MLIGLSCALTAALAGGPARDDLPRGRFHWLASSPLIEPAERPDDPCYSVKDPSFVRYNDRWHLFCTIRSRKRTHQIEYLSFADWKHARQAKREVLTVTDGYFAAPQVFFFAPQRKWYLLYQIIDHTRKPELQPAFSTTGDLPKPASWSKPALLFEKQPDKISMWIDFWIICDDTRAYLFFTSLDGQMWRSEARLADFPHGWSQPRVALRGDVFEASHTYRLRGMQKYLTLIEAQADGRRFYKAYLADRLDGAWSPLAATREQPFASPANVRETGPHWTDSFSHGELIRAGYDQTMEVDPAHLRFVFQGVTDERMRGKPYGEIPWRLGLLEPAP